MTDPCRNFEEHLPELIYDELGEAEAETLRMHAIGCDRCRTALEDALMVRKLVARLPEDRLADDIDGAIFSEAVRYAEGQRESFASSESQVPALVALNPLLTKKTRRYWIPAFAAAALAASVAVVSMLLVRDAKEPTAEHDHAPDLVAVNSRQSSAPDEPPFGPSPSASRFSEAPMKPSGGERLKKETAKERPEEFPVASRLGTSADQPKKKSSRRTRRAKRAESEADFEAAAPSAREDFRGPKSAAPLQFAQSPSDAGGIAPSEAAGALAAPTSNSEVSFEEAAQAFSRGDCGTAIAGFTPWAEKSRSDLQKTREALVGLARCESRRGRCSRAVVWYRRVLDDFPSHPSRPSLLWEAATCERKLGRVEQAKSYLEELEGFPAWKQRAQAGLREIEN